MGPCCSCKYICSVPCIFSSGNTPSDHANRKDSPRQTNETVSILQSDAGTSLWRATNFADKCSRMKMGAPAGASDHQDPTQHCSYFRASTQSLSLKTGNTRALQLGNVKTMVQRENYSARNTEELLTPAICHLRGLMDTAWQGKGPIRGSSGLRFHSMTCWRRPTED